MFDKQALYISIVIYLVIAFGFLYYKPAFLFSDKNKKWLDPGCGTGYFSIFLFY